ncbi:MAG: hypothetical protein M3O41_03045, partial [Pseudomonadota bacterium]|nr:hypothetical protein [Pseudomonadota bacterium]
MQRARVLAGFLFRAAIVGLAAAFLLVWWRPALLGAAPSRRGDAAAPVQSVSANLQGIPAPGIAA